MKKNLIKKVFAVSLSIAMACSLLPAANPVTASAAAPYVSLKTTFKTLKVGQSYKMTLKNNTVSWKIKKVETTDKKIATVYGKTTSSVMIKGKSEGRATVRVRLQTAKRKKNNTKTLRCRVKVVTSTTTPTNPVTPTQTDATVTTQQELTDALANTSITKITIKPASAVNFTIPSGTYSNVDLIVDAAQSDITNSATFKSITVENIKPETWTEKGAGNAFTWKAANGRLVVDKGASVRAITLPTANAKVAIDVQEGTIAAINVTAKVELSLTGKLAEGAAAIAISFSSAATDAKLTTAIKVAVTTMAKIAAIFEKGAEDSTVKLDAANISVDVTNNTTKAIVVTKNNNTTQSVSAGHKGSVSAVATTTTPGGSTSTGGSSSGTYKPATNNKINTGSAIKIYPIKGTVTTGSALAVSGVSIKFDIENVRAVTAAAIEYNATLVSKDGNYRFALGASGWNKMKYNTKTENGKTEIQPSYITVDSNITKDVPVGEYYIELQFRVAETSSSAASAAVKGQFSVFITENSFSFGIPTTGELFLK